IPASHENEAPPEMGFRKLALEPDAQDFLFDEDNGETHKPEPDDEDTGGDDLEEECDQNQPQHDKKAALGELPGGDAARTNQWPIVKPLRLQNQRCRGNQYQIKPHVIPERVRRLESQEVNHVFVRPQDIRQPEAESKKACIQQL